MAALRGDFRAALALHPLIFVVGPIIVSYAVLVAIDAFRPLGWFRSRIAERWMSRVTVGLAFLLFTLWVARFAGAFGGPVPTEPWFW
jgi:hypothetical protein